MLFNAFYQDSNIKNMENGDEKNQKILITALIYTIFTFSDVMSRN